MDPETPDELKPENDIDSRITASFDPETRARQNSLRDYEKSAAGSQAVNDIGTGDIQSREQNGGWKTTVDPTTRSSKKQGFMGRLQGAGRKKSTWAIGGVVIGGGGGILLLFTLLLPLKLIGLVSNITDAASRIPSYAVEQRTDYLMKRTMSTWLIRKGAGDTLDDAATNAVFCKGGSITCSFTWTRINKYFEDRYNLSDFGTGENGAKRVTLTPKNRDGFGANARAWTLDIEADLSETGISNTIKNIESNAEAKRFLNSVIDREMKTNSVITRYIARKALMKKYGVTTWRAFEKTSNNIAELKSTLKSSLIRNTVGKISPNAATYIGCLSGDQATCSKIKDLYESKITNLEKLAGETDEAFATRQAERSKALQKAANEAIGIVVPEEGVVAKLISKQLVTKLGAGVAIAGIIDTIAGAVESTGDGSLDTITHSIRSAAYVGYAFGDESGIVPNVERIKAGEEVDPNLMEVIAEQFENVEESPIFQAETGLMKNNATEGGYERTCDEDGKQKKVILTGTFVCPERQVVPNMSKITKLANMKGLREVAIAWNSTVGRLFDWAGDIVNFVMEHIGANYIISTVFGGVFTDFAEWVVGLFFDVPTLGDEATGDQNYDALSAGMWISQNGMMENGVEGGELYGGGGRLLSDSDIVAIQSAQRTKELEQFNSQSYLARMFNTDNSKSFASRFLAQLPVTSFTGSAGILTLPSTAIANFPTALLSPAKADAGPLNPHDMPLYGYAPGETVLTADPLTYTDEYCKDSADKRLKSYDKDASERYSIKVYTVADPCALERMAVGNLLYDMGVTDDTHSFKELSNSINCGPFGGSTGGSVGTKMSETEFKQLFSTYGLPDPQASTSPDLIQYGEPVMGYNDLLKQLKENPKAGWAAQALLNGEKKWKTSGGQVKEYLNTTWIWFENGQSAWPDPYEMNCVNNTNYRAAQYCSSTNFQAAGYQPGDARGKFKDVFDKMYKESELSSIMQAVIKNSTNASKDIWNYNDASNSGESSYFSDLSGVSFANLWPTKDFGDERAQIQSLILGKDPNMAAALNSFAVSDDDVLAHLGTGEGCGPGWGSYICKPARQQMANMMMALYMFDGLGPAAGANCASSGTGAFGGGAGISAVWGGQGEKDLSYGFDYGPAAGPWYLYSQAYGMSGFTHTGTDIPNDPYSPVYSPVEGIVVCEKNGVGEGIPGAGCAGAGDYSGMFAFGTNACQIGYDSTKGNGAGTVMIKITKNGQETGEALRLGHLAESLVKLGDKIQPHQQIGTVGCMNGWHTHVEYFIPDSTTSSGLRLVDPVKYLGGSTS